MSLFAGVFVIIALTIQRCAM